MTDQEIKEVGKEEMKHQYGYNANKPYYDNGFLLGYKKAQTEQLILSGVGCSLPSKEAMFIEELQRYNLEKEWDDRVNRSDFSKGFIECYKWITKKEFKVR